MALKNRIKSVSLIFACGTALFSDGYANGIIGSVNTLLTKIYGSEVLALHNRSRTLSSLSFAGTIVGMLSFGYLSDKTGRKPGMIIAAGIVAFFSGLSACSSGAHGSVGGLISMLSATRFLLGIGVGAEYPSGSVAASEQSEEEGISKYSQHRWLALATNCMIDFGFVIAAFTPLVLLWIFGEDHLRVVWRGSLFIGVFPALGVLVWRWSMVEPSRYKKDSMKHARIPYILVLRRYGWHLLAVSLIWFIYDFVAYPFNLFSSIVINNIIGTTQPLTVVFGWNVVINLFNIPGAIGGAFLLDYLGPRNTLVLGLLSQSVIGFIMSGLYIPLTNHIAAFAVVYGIFLSLGELGPGNCTMILASKTSPTAVRGHFYGVAAAVGKVGAFAGTWAFPPMIDAFGGPNTARGNTGPFWVASGLGILSAIVTIVGIKPLTHDGMVAEDIAFREYLEKNGYDTSAMGLTLEEAAELDDEKDGPEIIDVKEVA